MLHGEPEFMLNKLPMPAINEDQFLFHYKFFHIFETVKMWSSFNQHFVLDLDLFLIDGRSLCM